MFIYPFNDELDQTLTGKERQIPKILAVSGKGGTGKTTVTASMAHHHARAGKKVLVVSIDPAHSLGDSLELDLSDNKVHQVPGNSNLFAWEISLEPGKGAPAGSKQGSATPNPESIQQMMGEVFFPISEEANVIYGLIEVFNYINDHNRDIEVVFIDGAPSGHFLRVLSFPILMDNFLGKLMIMHQKLKAVFEFKISRRKLIKNKLIVSTTFKRIINILQNNAISSFILVTIPETMSLMETERTLKYLKDLGVGVKNVIINKIHDYECGDVVDCRFCRDRIAGESKILDEIPKRIKGVSFSKIPLFKDEIHGSASLNRVSELLFY
ncbi:MAG: ArsA family ATPase [Promethearchaeota archaeon]